MIWKMKQTWHPVWQYLNQPIFTASSQSVWNVDQFWYLYKIQLLENCWKKEIPSQTHYTL